MSRLRHVLTGAIALCLALTALSLFLGGCDGDGPNAKLKTEIARLEVYDPTANTWTTLRPMNEPRSTAAAVVINNKLYVVGGRDLERGYNALKVLEIYDPGTDSWTRGADMFTKRWGPAAAALDGKLYVVGGSLTADIIYDVVEIYDPATDSWSTGESMDTARYRPAIGVINGKIYVAGGMGIVSGNLQDVATMEVFDPAVGHWLSLENMPAARGQCAFGVHDSRLYLLGGFQWIGEDKSTLTRVDAFSPGGAWTTGLAAMSPGRAETAAGVINGKIYVVGGLTESGQSKQFHNRLDIYDIATNSWTTGAPSDTLRAEAAAGVINSKLYVVGGYDH